MMSVSFNWDENSYFEKYESKINKVIKKKLKLKDFSFEQIAIIDGPSTFLESYKIIDANSSSQLFMYCGTIVTCDLGGCTASKYMKSDHEGKEYFDILIIADSMKMIKQMKVLNYFSDYGYEIASKSYLKKYYKHNICDFNVETYKVDAISGATISSNAINDALILICESR
jgi:hypothetical protein